MLEKHRWQWLSLTAMMKSKERFDRPTIPNPRKRGMWFSMRGGMVGGWLLAASSQCRVRHIYIVWCERRKKQATIPMIHCTGMMGIYWYTTPVYSREQQPRLVVASSSPTSFLCGDQHISVESSIVGKKKGKDVVISTVFSGWTEESGVFVFVRYYPLILDLSAGNVTTLYMAVELLVWYNVMVVLSFRLFVVGKFASSAAVVSNEWCEQKE